jgi:hypothetical protein
MKEKEHHYTIGYCFDKNSVKTLLSVQKYVLDKYYSGERKEIHRTRFFSLPILYLGYLDFKHIQIYMDQTFTPLLQSVSSNVYSFPCLFDGIEIIHHGNYEKVYIRVSDPNKIIESIVCPYLQKYGIQSVYSDTKSMHLRIELLSIRTNVPIHTSKVEYVFKTKSFLFSYLTLIQSTPLEVRPGTPSLMNHANVHNMTHYRFPLLDKE